MPVSRRDFLAASAAAAAAGIVGRPRFVLGWQGQGPPPQPVFTPIRRNVGYFSMRGGTIGWLVNPGAVVVDEVAGQWITIAGAGAIHWKSALMAFVLFRLLDIWKPPPARQFERLPGGFGIMADDVMAGVYGALVLHALSLLNLY